MLVTGCPRSGTTFVGQSLSRHRSTDYFHEPLNPLCGLPSVETEYLDLADARASVSRREFEQLLDYRPMLRSATFARDTRWRRGAKAITGSRGPANLRLARVNPWSANVVVKDPFAVLSIPWLVEQHDFRSVAVVRHPAAVAASFERLGWDPGPSLRALRWEDPQLRMTPDHSSSREVRLARSAVLWRNLVSAIVNAPTLIVVHERISSDPISTLPQLADELGLPTGSAFDRHVRRSTSSTSRGRAVRSGPTQQFRRDSSQIFEETMAALTEHELDLIWEHCGDIAARWYGRNGLLPGDVFERAPDSEGAPASD